MNIESEEEIYKKITKKVKKERIIKNIVLFIEFLIIFFMFFTNILKQPVTNLDELWNYNTARCIKNGLLPYRDISMITTPLLPTIVAIFLKIFGDNLLVFRILHAILITGIFFLLYKVFLKSDLYQTESLFITIILAFVYYNYTFLDYNYVCLLISLLILFIEVKAYNETNNYDFIIGLLAGCAICTKQTVGVFIGLGVIITGIYKNKIYKNLYKKDLSYYENETVLLKVVPNRGGNEDTIRKIKQKTIKDAKVANTDRLKGRILGIIIPCIIFLIYLLATNTLNDFINYGVKGIKTFTNKITYWEMLSKASTFERIYIFFITFSFIMELVCFVFWIIKKIKIYKKNDETYSPYNFQNNIRAFLFISSFVMLIVIYPICDYSHFLIGTLGILINAIYYINLCLIKIHIVKGMYDNKLEIFLDKFIICVCMFFCVMKIIGNVYEYKKAYNKDYSVNHFEYLPVSDRQKEINNTLNDFYKKNSDYKIVIADSDACAYTIPLDKYNKNYDMFLKGNIGKDGEDGIIEDIKNSSKTIYLLKNKSISLNWQSPTKDIDYIRDNLEFKGNVGIFEIYVKE